MTAELENNTCTDTSRDYYLYAFEELDSGEVFKWNWSAFFFNSLWFYTRGMYWYGLSLFVFISLLDMVLSLCTKQSIKYVTMATTFFTIFVVGGYGTKLYHAHIKKLVKQGRHLYPKYKSKDYVPPIMISLINIVFIFIGEVTKNQIKAEIIFLLVCCIVTFLLDHWDNEKFRKWKQENDILIKDLIKTDKNILSKMVETPSLSLTMKCILTTLIVCVIALPFLAIY